MSGCGSGPGWIIGEPPGGVPSCEAVGSIEFVKRFYCGNADVMPLFSEERKSWVCFFVPYNERGRGAFITLNEAGQIVVETGVPYDTLMNGYEHYIEAGFVPVVDG